MKIFCTVNNMIVLIDYFISSHTLIRLLNIILFDLLKTNLFTPLCSIFIIITIIIQTYFHILEISNRKINLQKKNTIKTI